VFVEIYKDKETEKINHNTSECRAHPHRVGAKNLKKTKTNSAVDEEEKDTTREMGEKANRTVN